MIKHPKIVRNLDIEQWFCATCGRTSDHVTEQDARAELDQFDCQLPYVEIPIAMREEDTVRPVKKPFKMELKNESDEPTQGKDEQYSSDTVWVTG
jgi:hypothetical protein